MLKKTPNKKPFNLNLQEKSNIFVEDSSSLKNKRPEIGLSFDYSIFGMILDE